MGGLKQSVMSLIHNTKLPVSFNSAIWKKGYNPDLIFVYSNILDMCEKSVLDPIPRTQHRPICVTVNPVIVPQPTTFKIRLTGRKLTGTGFQQNLMLPSKKLIRSQKTMEGSYNYYVWCPEDIFQEDVDQTTNLFSKRSPRVSIKHTQYRIQATLLAKVHWRLEHS